LRAGFFLREDLSFGLRYSLYQRSTAISGVTPSPAIVQAVGTALTSSVGYTLAYNTLDNLQNPNEGFYAALSQDFAGLGGDQFIRSAVDARYYYPLTNDFTLMLRGQAGHVWAGAVRLNISTISKGPRLVRGFRPRPDRAISTAYDAGCASSLLGATGNVFRSASSRRISDCAGRSSPMPARCGIIRRDYLPVSLAPVTRARMVACGAARRCDGSTWPTRA
jgi:hypothetical protein